MTDAGAPPFDLKPLYGPALVGLVLSAFLCGLVTLQTFFYYRNYSKDPTSLKLYVFIIWFLQVVHVIVIFMLVYYYTVLHWVYGNSILSALNARHSLQNTHMPSGWFNPTLSGHPQNQGDDLGFPSISIIEFAQRETGTLESEFQGTSQRDLEAAKLYSEKL
ncbi:hypothetical protein M422DRAFT_273946 [Sphaerobolus stellatus SS14]|uniref:Uncharacterized protein n=1 Tax=Sphaerobolus stellatus (strain SS14) TaxID=990650 RepID=A0A0C9UIQ8_SPHS4|nr:hypothetical protein M422DRAFT_273946 [Sphaerobolus stellatus SS14]